MGVNKNYKFSEEENELADICKALAHPARIAILKLLIQRNSCICGELVDELPLAQSTISQHLKELKKSGLIQGIIEGPAVCYCINPDIWKKARNILSGFISCC